MTTLLAQTYSSGPANSTMLTPTSNGMNATSSATSSNPGLPATGAGMIGLELFLLASFLGAAGFALLRRASH